MVVVVGFCVVLETVGTVVVVFRVVVVAFCVIAVVLVYFEVVVVPVRFEAVDVDSVGSLVFLEVVVLFIPISVVDVRGAFVLVRVIEVVVLGKVTVRLAGVVVVLDITEDVALADGVTDVVVSKRLIEVSKFSWVVLLSLSVGTFIDTDDSGGGINKKQPNATANTKAAARITCHRLL